MQSITTLIFILMCGVLNFMTAPALVRIYSNIKEPEDFSVWNKTLYVILTIFRVCWSSYSIYFLVKNYGNLMKVENGVAYMFSITFFVLGFIALFMVQEPHKKLKTPFL